MAAILSSPQVVPAAWGMDEGAALSSPVARDALLPHELDHSFGSSMSISSLDSPGRAPPRSRGVTTTLDVLAEDPFSAPSSSDAIPAGIPWEPRLRPESAYPKSSPHAMEISSPATFSLMPAPPALSASAAPTASTLPSAPDAPDAPYTRSTASAPHARAAPSPLVRNAPAAPAPLAGRHALPRSTDRAVRRSMPQLPSSISVHPDSPQQEPPMKRRLSTLRQLHDADGVPEASDACSETGAARSGPCRERAHARSQSVGPSWLRQASAGHSSQASGSSAMRTSLLPSPMPAPSTSDVGEDSWSFSRPEPVKRPCFASSSKAAVSPGGVGDYFFHPESPQVGSFPGGGGLLAPPTLSPTSSPTSSPCVRGASNPLLRTPGLFYNDTAQAGPTPCLRTSTVHNVEAVPCGGAPTEEAEDAAMLPGAAPQVHGGSPMRASQRKNRLVGMTARRTQTTMGPACVEKENEVPLAHHISPGLPGFGTFEMDSKVLPCFPVKSDGLMRITPQTVRDLYHGKYDERICGFQVIDCRFAYEHEGGHIAGAINLNSVEQVQQHFLAPGKGFHEKRRMPTRTQSGMPDASGDTRKFLLIFHCEFSWKRAPSMALALRAADRSLASDYPKCHFPDVYVLQGGYADFFKACPELCEPRAYVPMDDPRFLRRRSEELTGFRKQFARNRSFAYGDEHFSALTMLSARMNAQGNAHTLTTRPAAERDTSFSSNGDSSFEADASCSPCAAATHRRPAPLEEIGGMAPPSLMHAFARRPMARAETMPSAAPMARGCTAPASPMRP